MYILCMDVQFVDAFFLGGSKEIVLVLVLFCLCIICTPTGMELGEKPKCEVERDQNATADIL